MPEGLEFWTATEIATCIIDDVQLRNRLLDIGDFPPRFWWGKLQDWEQEAIVSAWDEEMSV